MKHELPPFRMTVDAGRLTPADPYTAERLDSYRNGSVMFMQPVIDPLSRKRKQYWAILSRVIADCPSPWRRVTEASTALKVALGVVEHGRTIVGVDVRYPRSLNDLTEPEFEDFFEDAMSLLHRVTGVDPMTLGKEASDTGNDLEPPAGVKSSLATAGADSGGAPLPAAAVANPLKGEAVGKFLEYASDDTLTPDQRLAGLPLINDTWLEQLPDEAAFFKACSTTAAKLINGKTTKKAAESYLLALAAKEGKGTE
jgi:hypothetical protein